MYLQFIFKFNHLFCKLRTCIICAMHLQIEIIRCAEQIIINSQLHWLWNFYHLFTNNCCYYLVIQVRLFMSIFLIMYVHSYPCMYTCFHRSTVFKATQHMIHLNLAIALLLGLIVFVGGIETATENTVS